MSCFLYFFIDRFFGKPNPGLHRGEKNGYKKACQKGFIGILINAIGTKSKTDNTVVRIKALKDLSLAEMFSFTKKEKGANGQ